MDESAEYGDTFEPPRVVSSRGPPEFETTDSPSFGRSRAAAANAAGKAGIGRAHTSDAALSYSYSPTPASQQESAPGPSAALQQENAPVGVEGVKLGGAPVAVDAVWSVELPQCATEFSVEVELSNGLTIIVPHPSTHIDGQWFIVAKDSGTSRQLVARFHPHTVFSAFNTVVRLVGSPFSTDLSAMVVLLLATLLSTVGGDAGSRKPADVTDGPPSALRQASPRGSAAAIADACRALALACLECISLDAASWLRAALFAAFALAFIGRILSKLTERFPPQQGYTLVIKPHMGDEDLLPRARLVDGALGSHTLIKSMTDAFNAAIMLPPESGAPSASNNSSPGTTEVGADGTLGSSSRRGGLGSRQPLPLGEVELRVEPLLDAIAKSLGYGEIFGPLMVIGVKNDEGNLRKCRKALADFSEADTSRVWTLRALLEAECATGMHKPGAVLEDPSAAIAFLWMRRTLQFLQHCFQGVIDDRLPMPAVGAGAYKLNLEPFHGWFLKNTFGMALNGMPSRAEVIERLGDATVLDPRVRERRLMDDIRLLLEVLKATTDAMRSLFEELDLEDTRKA